MPEMEQEKTVMVGIEMQMPKCCKDCPMKDERTLYCKLIGDYCDWLAAWAAQCRPEQCPLIDLSCYEDDLK